MALFGTRKEKDVVKKVRKKKKGKELASSVKTVIEIKTVGDIPPIIEARQAISEGELNQAAINGFRTMKRDYIRYFRVNPYAGGSNRDFIIRTLSSLGVTVKENAFVDNLAILEAIDGGEESVENDRAKYNALRKLTRFYLEFYEKARFSHDLHGDGENIVDKMIEVYNYMDIMYLYFPEANMRKAEDVITPHQSEGRNEEGIEE